MTNSGHGSSSGLEPSPTQNGTIDAGLRGLDHYRRALPKWRYAIRERMLPLVRWETPYLALLQNKLRTPALDSYFAITANLGTHTFFMVFLPILFWSGFYGFAKGVVRVLAAGVFCTSWLKDMLSLPRPLSPPLHRITMSGSVALEYGFPSTHSTNAVSVVVYAILCLRSEANPFSPTTKLILEGLSYFYAGSIVFGRLYCGMHGFLDVIVGSIMGAVISLIEFYSMPLFDEWMYSSSYLAPLATMLAIFVLVRIHPEPADDCPCFDDSVAFAGTMVGIEFGTWHLSKSQWWAIYNGPDASFDLAALGWPVAVARIVSGIFVIFAWRGIAKPTLLRLLPHVFRIIETHGWSLPRRFFVPASEYKDVPLHVRDDNVLPNVSDLPKMVASIRGPGRGRSVSIGPQSAADAYETLAYRERRRRESVESDAAAPVRKQSLLGLKAKADGDAIVGGDHHSQASGVQSGRLVEFEQQMGRGTVAVDPASDSKAEQGVVANGTAEGAARQGDELGEKEMFSKLVKPRVRYDVEVVTKLVVYAGIGWWAVDGIITGFELIGLGAGHLGVR